MFVELRAQRVELSIPRQPDDETHQQGRDGQDSVETGSSLCGQLEVEVVGAVGRDRGRQGRRVLVKILGRERGCVAFFVAGPVSPASMQTLYGPSGKPSLVLPLKVKVPSLSVVAVLVTLTREDDLTRSERFAVGQSDLALDRVERHRAGGIDGIAVAAAGQHHRQGGGHRPREPSPRRTVTPTSTSHSLLLIQIVVDSHAAAVRRVAPALGTRSPGSRRGPSIIAGPVPSSHTGLWGFYTHDRNYSTEIPSSIPMNYP